MTPWRAVQEALYQRFVDAWVDGDGKPLTPVQMENETFDPPDGPWVNLMVQRRAGGPGTIGKPGNRKMDRAGAVFVLVRVKPGDGVGELSDYADRASKVYENCRFAPYDIRFGEVEPGQSYDVDKGRYRGVSVEGRFDYEEIR